MKKQIRPQIINYLYFKILDGDNHNLVHKLDDLLYLEIIKRMFFYEGILEE